MTARAYIMRLFSYVVARDYGFAPNPFYSYCTLAACKPDIRKHVKVDDWVLGTDSNAENIRRGNYAIYVMRVTEALSFNEYWQDPRFIKKRPYLAGSKKQAYGDNIYHRVNNKWKQQASHHNKYTDGRVNEKNLKRDTGVDRVLISDDFIYWGSRGYELPELNGEVLYKKRQGCRNRFKEETVEAFVKWYRSLREKGFCSPPKKWQSGRFKKYKF